MKVRYVCINADARCEILGCSGAKPHWLCRSCTNTTYCISRGDEGKLPIGICTPIILGGEP